MKRYKIWDKKSPVITPAGEVLTAEQWIERYPVAGLESITVLCGAGEINGSVFATLGQTVTDYENLGCDFTGCTTDEEKLEAIEAFEASKELEEAEAMAEAMARKEIELDSLASIAASLEYQNMLTLEDVEV